MFFIVQILYCSLQRSVILKKIMCAPPICYVCHPQSVIASYGPGGGGGGGGRGYSDISRMRRLGLFFGGFKIMNFIIFWGFQKNKYFLGV